MNIEKQIEFDKIKEIWIQLAVTDQAKEEVKNISFYLSERELRKQLKDTTDGKDLMEKLGTPPLQNITETKEILAAAEKGDCLTPYQLERVEKVLVAVKRLKDYLIRGKVYNNPVAFYEENLEAAEDLKEEIIRQIRGGAVDSHASKELWQIREQMLQCEEQMKQKAEQVMRSHKECMADHYCTYRNGRICLPVKKEYKYKIPGSLIGRSATGNTLFIEPAGAAKQYEELQLLAVREQNEIYRILYTLTAMVAAYADVIKSNASVIEKLDFLLSKGKLSMELGAVEPSVNTNGQILLKDARHPLMDRGTHVPLQFEIGGNVKGIVITGPNTGGKTVAIKTVMLNCCMAQCGLHVTCREANICMNRSYLCDIGDGQDIAENLSTFSAHICNVLEVLQEAGPGCLVIMDELGSGTDPTEGMGIAIAILGELIKSGSLFLATTHYPEVKEYAEKTPGIINARMSFDKDTLKPTYQMVIGEAGESCAFYIASRLGMPNHMLRTAILAAYGEEAARVYPYQNQEVMAKERKGDGISKMKKPGNTQTLASKYQRGDSVTVYPGKKIGIVCQPINEKGLLRVQMPDKKIWVSHKRVKLLVAAAELYPEGYDFSILFDTVANRKIRHDMERKYTENVLRYDGQ